MNRIRRQKSSLTKQGILDACLAELNLNGYSNSSIDQIALRAGVSKMSVYYHFSSKEALFTEAIIKIIREFSNELTIEIDKFEDHREAFSHISGIIWDHFFNLGQSFYSLLDQLRNIDPELRSQITIELRVYADIVKNRLNAAQADGQISFENDSIMTHFFVGIGSTIQWYDPNGAVSPDQFREMMRSKAISILGFADKIPAS